MQREQTHIYNAKIRCRMMTIWGRITNCAAALLLVLSSLVLLSPFFISYSVRSAQKPAAEIHIFNFGIGTNPNSHLVLIMVATNTHRFIQFYSTFMKIQRISEMYTVFLFSLHSV